MESAYEECLFWELTQNDVRVQRQVPLPMYKGLHVEAAYRLDLVVDGRLVVEVKSVDQLASVHQAQLLTYLKLSKIRAGLLLNFNVTVLRTGIKRMVV